MSHVLIPLDGSLGSEKALEYAEKMAGAGGTVTLLTVVNLPPRHVFNDASNVLSQAVIADVWGVHGTNREERTDEVARSIVTHAEDYLRRLVERLSMSGLQVNTRMQLDIRPAEAIIQSAHELGVASIVMVTEGPSSLWRRAFGGVTAEVVSNAPCPVFVIPSAYEHSESQTETVQLEHA